MLVLLATLFHFLLCSLIDLNHVYVDEGQCMILPTGDAPDLEQTHLGAFTKTLENAGFRHDFIGLITKSAIHPIAPAIDDLIGGGPGEGMTVSTRDVGDIGRLQAFDQRGRLHLLHRALIRR